MAVAKVVVAQDPKGRAATVPWAVDLAPAGTHATTPTDSSRIMAVAAAAGDYHLAGKAPRIPVVARPTTSIVPPMMLGLGTQLQENVGRP